MRIRSTFAALSMIAFAAAVAGLPGASVRAASQHSECSRPATDPMPQGAGHDHTDPTQHRFECELHAAATLDLKDTVPEPELFGEIDLAGDIAVMATTFPQAGFVVLDVSDPAAPVVLSRFRGGACNPKVDIDCGADVKVTPDARYAFLAVQGSAETPKGIATPGIVTVDIADPRAPKQIGFVAVPPVGVHMLAFHKIGNDGWIFARARGLGDADAEPGVAIYRVEPGGRLSKTGEIVTEGAHDVTLYDDPVDRRTYLYLSGAQSGTMFVYDVADPLSPRRVGAWKPKPEVAENAWYMHNAWTFRSGDKRYTFAGPELYGRFGSLPPGHGGVAGPLWLLDTTDHDDIKLIGEWRNPSDRAAGNLTFSPHNTWYAGAGITWTSHYHGGVWVLDWNRVLAGQAREPRVVGYHVPHTARREFVESQAEEKFMTAEAMRTRPLIWDVVAKGRYGFASDINGGFVVLELPAPPGLPSASASGSPGSPAEAGGSRAGGSGPALAVAIVLSAIVVAASAMALRRRR